MSYLTGSGETLETLNDVVARIKVFFDEAPEAEFEIMMGTDAQSYKKQTVYATAIGVHRISNGGIYFIQKYYVRGKGPYLYEKLLKETSLTITLAEKLIPKLATLVKEHGYNIINIYADGDVSSTDGASEVMKPTVEGMFKAYGLKARTKPYAAAANSIADRHC